MREIVMDKNGEVVECSVFRRRIRSEHYLGYRRLTVLFVYGREREMEEDEMEQTWPPRLPY